MNRILLIDDDAELREMLCDYLVGEGCEVGTAANGEAGVPMALSGEYMLVVLDVMMPGMGGIEALKRIREQSDLPVVMLTAKGEDMDRIVGLELGADDYVPKQTSVYLSGCNAIPLHGLAVTRIVTARWLT